MAIRGFTLTKHAIARLHERFPDMVAPFTQLSPGLKLKGLYSLLENSVEEKRFLNDVNFMQYVHRRYGYENRYRMFINGDIIFVAAGEVIVTVISLKSSNSSSHIHKLSQAKAIEEYNKHTKRYERPSKHLSATALTKYKKKRKH